MSLWISNILVFTIGSFIFSNISFFWFKNITFFNIWFQPRWPCYVRCRQLLLFLLVILKINKSVIDYINNGTFNHKKTQTLLPEVSVPLFCYIPDYCLLSVTQSLRWVVSSYYSTVLHRRLVTSHTYSHCLHIIQEYQPSSSSSHPLLDLFCPQTGDDYDIFLS